MAENGPKIEDSAFLKYEKTENKNDDYLKKIDAFSDQEMMRNGEGNVNELKKDGILDSKDGEKIKKEFNEFLEKFSSSIGENKRVHENIGKISDKIEEVQKQNKDYNKDFLVLGGLISDLKNDLTENKGESEEVDNKLTKKEKLQKLEKISKSNLKIDFENNKVFDEALDKPDGIGQILKGWLGKEKIKELFKIPFLGGILKGFLGLPKDFKFSNKAEEGIGSNKIDTKGFKYIKTLDGLKTKLYKISPKNLKGVDKLMTGIAEIQGGKGKDLIQKTFNNLAKYSNGIKNFNSKNVEFSKDKKNASFEIETNGAVNSIFLRKEINGESGSGIGGKSDTVKVITDVLKGKGDISGKFEKITKELKNLVDVDKIKDLMDSDGNIKIAIIDPDKPEKLNITFISSKELVKKSKDK